MTVNPIAEVLRAGFELLNAGDIDSVRASLADDVLWHGPPAGPLGGDFVGPDAVVRTLAEAYELTVGSVAFEVLDMFVDSRHVVVVVRETAQRGDRSLDARESHVFHLDAQGRITEFWDLPEDPETHDAFYA